MCVYIVILYICIYIYIYIMNKLVGSAWPWPFWLKPFGLEWQTSSGRSRPRSARARVGSASFPLAPCDGSAAEKRCSAPSLGVTAGVCRAPSEA